MTGPRRTISLYDPSRIKVQFPPPPENPDDTALRTVGSLAHPVSILVPSGWRTYPGRNEFVRQLMPDGTWAPVIWTPDVEM